MSHKAMWIYPWDLADEGIESVISYLVEDVGINAVALATAYHSVEHLRPRSHGSKFYRSSQASLYFEPDSVFFSETKLRPYVSPLVKGNPVLPRFVEACCKHGVKAESWTVFLHNSYLATKNPDCAQRNVYDDSMPYALCPANPDVRTYAVGLSRNLAAIGIQIIELESLSYMSFGHTHYHSKSGVDFGGAQALFGLCLCQDCRKRGGNADIDVDRMTSQIRNELDDVFQKGKTDNDFEHYLEKIEGLEKFIQVRQSVISSLLQEIKDAVDIELNFILMGDNITSGFAPKTISQISDKVEILAYTPSADQMKDMIYKKYQEIDSREKLVVGYSVYGSSTPNAETLYNNVQTAMDTGVTHFAFYNYGIMPSQNLGWVKRANEIIDSKS
ncbi:TPA: hypothetical protein EYN98_18475 [Candidatus Poribacteria bacterium]|nr:hypothetical protein [Candidatus Poribacteria bacterium]HIA67993.1 hypothetical protein [Candidatus Poribacteria bacterium]HIB90525.1 hypothetical protein [Candidatus Poribacteria bacterium]HIC18742.1 hypothetical protein [Candidatus Poribacteria bacterium]HIN30841.1 hypothetical protein [Candidatus Poribacteria bacterium]